MKNLILIFSLMYVAFCMPLQRVDIWKTLTMPPGESLYISEVKVPVTLEMKNLSDKEIHLSSKLDMPESLSAESELRYRLPKKGSLTIENRNTVPVSVYLHYTSSKSIFINNKELR
ncbi:hypothetical protein [Chryseobacterium hagamense]|uniref:Uncharacterized protein n=1 Tax=Chryseobacterium hagamense TaxID=395935 RepID=A0A511YKW5_9FLAO|nr:hypothetical protein [Chryseobacterium hagamense]GEN75824.1 hypothetical protein CHA01nite_15640 [Chryseobacterium hagamense]